jgi:hypothetical protein
MQGDRVNQSVQIAKATIAGEQRTGIEIQTADGDKVTLSSDIKFESAALTYEELDLTRASYSKSRGQIISAHANSKLELNVEGTLDELEKKEIKKVLMNLFKMVNDFLTGKADTAEADNFANLRAVSAVKAEFDINATITIATQSSANYVTQTPVEEKPAIQEMETANIPAVSERVDKLTDHMVRVVKDSDIEPSEILKRLNRRLSRFSKRFMHERPADWNRMRLRQLILEDFINKLKQLSAENEVKIKPEDQDYKEKVSNLTAPEIAKTTPSVSETILNVASQDFHFEVEFSVSNDS